MGVKEFWAGVPKTWILVLVPALPLIGCVTLGKLRQLSVLDPFEHREAPAGCLSAVRLQGVIDAAPHAC